MSIVRKQCDDSIHYLTASACKYLSLLCTLVIINILVFILIEALFKLNSVKRHNLETMT